MTPLADENDDDQRLARLLAAAGEGAAPPDYAFLDRLRGQSAQAFRDAAPPLPLPRKRTMTATILRTLGAAAAAAILAAFGLFFWTSPASGTTLGRVLEQTAAADTLHLRLTRGGHSGEAWVRRAGRLRWDESADTYEIGLGDRLWRVDEKANRAAPGPSPYFPPGHAGVDLLALVGLQLPAELNSLLATPPVERVEESGQEVLVYRADVPGPGGRLRLEARADSATGRLRSLEATRDRAGVRETVAALAVLAVNAAVDDEKFVVRDTLTEDGRVGKVTDAQGVVTVRPLTHQRWTPARNNLLLKPGDWVRTDPRGANAAALRLVPRTNVVLGPGTLAEVVSPGQVRLHEGELELSAAGKSPVALLGPDGEKVEVKDKAVVYRVQKGKLARVEKEPLWLKGFKGTTAEDPVGSLVAKVDGRNVPLTVGYHKVTVDVRDQIARTVIEESFVNHTDTQLEGVFHFPLPQDASISGFGMWIGNELVDADVVEKQRAREIYETILTEKRDPGLLEWEGGNVFKARVWPIFAHAEKRIKITYTQVLPLEGNRYRYSYGLQSELLRQHPLRELAVDVTVHSALPLKSVASPTHPVRAEQTAHSARLSFAAQEYTPSSDFEVVAEVDGKQTEVVLVPHRRGDDGYFLLQLTPPAAGDADRALVPDGAPLRLLMVADTSASMDRTQRARQEAVLMTVLASLTPKDTFNLAACDVDCAWAFANPVPAEPDNVARAWQFLHGRASLGWTDLDRAFASALKQSASGTHVLYVGDGIPTTGDADPAAFAARLRKLYEDSGRPGTFHAVSTGNSFEPTVLKAVAALGGGSWRHVGGEQNPQAVALGFLNEVARPAVRDLKVEFRGLRTAKVYPGELPNLPEGTQQILLGRYLPEGRDQSGEVVVSGTRGGKPVRFSAPVTLKDAEQGNAFIPRLWARMHLDQLLARGSSGETKEEVIALSEEFQIITPYTSFLVLESDADRERFGVKRRFRMRDGERFFAKGRDDAGYELLQKQMKRAGDWRLGLRRQALRQLAGLGRDLSDLAPALAGWDADLQKPFPSGETAGVTFGRGRFAGERWRDRLLTELDEISPKGLTLGRLGDVGGLGGASLPYPVDGLLGDGEWAGEALDRAPDGRLGAKDKKDTDEREYADKAEKGDEVADREEPADEKSRNRPAGDEGFEPLTGRKLAKLRSELDDDSSRFAGPAGAPGAFAPAGRPMSAFGYLERDIGRGGRGGYLAKARLRFLGDPGEWLAPLFPHLPAAPVAGGEPKSAWPAPARELAQSLLRTDKLRGMKGGVVLVRTTERFDPRWDELTSRSERREVYSPSGWLTREQADSSQIRVEWCDGRGRGAWSPAFGLGRVRAATPQDLRTPPLELSDYSLSPLDVAFSGFSPVPEPKGEGRTLLVLRRPDNPAAESRILVDTARHVVLSVEHRRQGKVVETTTFGDFAEAAGGWWARRVETTDDRGRRTALVTQTVEAVGPDALARQLADGLSGRDGALLVRQPLPSVADAKRALAAGKATFDDRLTLLTHAASAQQWERAAEQLRGCEDLARGKDGARWLRDAVLRMSRRNDELRRRLLEEARRLADATAGKPVADEAFLAEYLLGQAGPVLEANEMLGLLDRLRPLFERQPAHTQAARRWTQMRVNHLQNAGRAEDALRLQKQLAADHPHDFGLQQQYAGALVAAGNYDAAYALLDRLLGKDARWLPNEEETLRSFRADFLERQGRYPELVDYLAGWVARAPEGETACARYLTALLRGGQEEKMNELLAQWLREGRADRPSPAVTARLHAAVAQMLGNGYGLYTNRIDERWLQPLADAALVFAKQEARIADAERILSHGSFVQSDECRRVRKELGVFLGAGVGRLSPDHLARLFGWVSVDGSALDKDGWKRVADVLRDRWAAEPDAQRKNHLGRTLGLILAAHDSPAAVLQFLHRQHREGPAAFRGSYADRLFQALLGQPWSAEYEDEALALLPRLAPDADAGHQAAARVAALHRLTDAMLAGRVAAATKAMEHPEKLTRTELAAKKAEDLRLAREGLSDRLGKEAAKAAPALAPWLKAERLYLETLLGRDPKAVAAACREFLGAAPPKTDVPAEGHEAEARLDEILRDRYVTTLANLASRKGADPALADRLLKYLEAGAAAEGEGDRWKLHQMRLLVALDRPKDLEQALRAWLKADDPDGRWQLALGYLLAEQGRVPDAIRLFEALEKADELPPAAYRTLADWYLAAGRRADHERALVASYKTLEEWRIGQALQYRLQPWQRGDTHLPSELDQDVLRLFAALFEKSAQPQAYLWQIQQYYQATHDFRLLAGLADAVFGQTAAKVYPFLSGMQGVLNEVRDEATADELLAQIDKVRSRAKTPVDRRALDLLEVQVRRRAAELKNQPGPHAEAALAALKRSFKGERSPGESRLMGGFLSAMGRIAHADLAAEQLKELETLYREAAKGSSDRLDLAHSYANALHAYDRTAEAVDVLGVGLTEYRRAEGGALPSTANGPMASLVGFFQQSGKHALGEEFLKEQLAKPANRQQGLWLTQQLYGLHYHALLTGGRDSLGSGDELYRALRQRLADDLATDDPNHRNAVINQLIALFRTAAEKKFGGVADDVRAFAFKRLPVVLKSETDNFPWAVRQAAQTVHDLVGPPEGAAFLLDRIDDEPAWLRYSNQDVWSQCCWQLGQWREEAKGLGADDARLLRVVLHELRRDLESRQQRNRALYHRQYGGFYWAEKEGDFAEAAEAVLAKQKGSGPACQYVADYFFYGLNRTGRGIAVLFDARARKILDEGGQSTLVVYLHHDGRYGESVDLLKTLVEKSLENLQYRVWLLSAYFHTGKAAELTELLARTDKFFHEKGRWTEPVQATLAQSCLENQRYEAAAGYYREAVASHKRSGGAADGTLSGYYAGLARAHSGLGNTADAVDAAGAAVVSWGPDQRNRTQALEALRLVLAGAADLEGFVARLDARTAETGLVNPVVRKALGQVYVAKEKYAPAAVQLQLAVEAQPNDSEAQQLLLSCYDKLGNKGGAVALLLDSLQAGRRDPAAYKELGKRLADQGRTGEAERAYTSAVEVLPNEAESHALLAEVRQDQDRWGEAIAEWRHAVRLRALEPAGLLKLAAAQVHERQWAPAEETLRQLNARAWPPRFGDVPGQVRVIEQQVEQGRKASENR